MQLALLEAVPLCIEAVCQSRQIYRLTASRPSAPSSTDRPRRPHTSILLKVAGIVVLAPLLLLPYYHHHRGPSDSRFAHLQPLHYGAFGLFTHLFYTFYLHTKNVFNSLNLY